jgi:hypothetical protein
VTHLQGIEGSSRVGPGEALEIAWPPLAIRMFLLKSSAQNKLSLGNQMDRNRENDKHNTKSIEIEVYIKLKL